MASSKVCSLEELVRRRTALRDAGRRLVHCHGCFDIVHPGHIRHLRFAKSQGDALLVSITGDEGVRKGTGRPLIPQELRAENLAELDCVDLVYIDPEETAQSVLTAVEPDIYIKGKEYETSEDPRFLSERSVVERGGGRIVFSSGDVVFSSTALIAGLEQSVDPFHKRLTTLTQREELALGTLQGLIASMRGLRVTVIGETILDTYLMCDQPEVAGESPVMTLRPLERRTYDGGAAIIARHAAALGAKPVLVTALPDGEASEALRQRLEGEGVEVRALGVREPIPEKERYLVGAQKVMKVDRITPMVLDAEARSRLEGMGVEAAREHGEAVIVADFGLGLLGSQHTSDLTRALRPLAGVMSGDVSGRRSGLLAMREMDLLCPSERELREACRVFDEGLSSAAWELLHRTKSGRAIVTMGADGLVAFDRLPESMEGTMRRLRGEHVPALSAHAVDALGCGDSLLTAATLALARGGSLVQGAFLGAVAASAQSQRLGNLPVSAADLRQGVARVHSAHLAFASAEVIGARAGAGKGGASLLAG